MSFWVDAALFALLVWGSQYALFLVCALACVVGPRYVPALWDAELAVPEPVSV